MSEIGREGSAAEGSCDPGRLGDLFDRLNAVEAQLDTEPLAKGRLIADLLTVGVLASVALATDWTITHPVLLLSLLVVGTGVNRGIPFLRRRALRAERERLTEAVASLRAGQGEAVR